MLFEPATIPAALAHVGASMRWLAVVSLVCLAGCSSVSSSSGPGTGYGRHQRVKVGAWIGAAAGVALAVVVAGDDDDPDCPSADCPEPPDTTP
jgi:hypothetical protein